VTVSTWTQLQIEKRLRTQDLDMKKQIAEEARVKMKSNGPASELGSPEEEKKSEG